MKPVPRLLITRFSPHAERLVDSLNDIGCFAVAQPLLTVEALNDSETLNTFLSGSYDLVIAVSGNAVKYAQQKINTDWPIAIYLAVGQSTQKQLSQATGQIVKYPSIRFDSEGLLGLEVLQSIKNKRILILRGEGGRELLEETLLARGATVDFLQTYKRIKIDLNGQQLVNNWKQAAINGVIISSVEVLNQLFTLVPTSDKSWLSDLIFYVPSQRVAEQASMLEAKHVVLLPSLHTEHIVEFFKADNGNVYSPFVF